MDALDKLVASIEHLQSLNGAKFTIDQQLDSVGKSLDAPLKDRLRSTSEEAINRAEMEKAIRGQPFDISKAEAIAHEYLREKILKDFR